ncbi:MAG TPA: type II toxin-antitoxin system RelE/ParE family toxin [Acidobacteriaceae bacterium]|nr:type II toxin-antitoxin system RelE/ParE family toxin [Acidobacteriaceae bacterium]
MMQAINWTRYSAASSRTTSNPCPVLAKASKKFACGDSGIYRVIYTARLADAVYVLHAFQKKTQATAKRDIATARERFAQLRRERK